MGGGLSRALSPGKTKAKAKANATAPAAATVIQDAPQPQEPQQQEGDDANQQPHKPSWSAAIAKVITVDRFHVDRDHTDPSIRQLQALANGACATLHDCIGVVEHWCVLNDACDPHLLLAAGQMRMASGDYDAAK